MSTNSAVSDPVFLDETKTYGLIFENYVDRPSGEPVNYALYNKITKFIELRVPNYPSALEIMLKFEVGVREAQAGIEKMATTSKVVALPTKNKQH